MDKNAEVLARIIAEMTGGMENSRKAQAIAEKISQGKATYADALDYAQESGKVMNSSLRKNLPDVLTDGKLYREAADQVVRKPMERSGKQVAEVAAEIQQYLNEDAGIGIRAITPEVNEDQITGIITDICNAESYDAGKDRLFTQVENFLEGTVDDCVRENADFQYKAGMSPKIERRTVGKCCEWCSKLAGTYEYDDVKDRGNDVFRRHKNCHCIVSYNPGDGSKRRQNVHTGRWTNEDSEELRERKIIFGEQRESLNDYKRVRSRAIENYSKNNLYIDQNANLSPKEISRINAQISEAKKIHGITKECTAPFIIVSESSSLASYNPRTNEFFISSRLADTKNLKKVQLGYACSNDTRSTMVHELFHWKDAEYYRQNVGKITDASQKSAYSVYQREEAAKKLIEAGIDISSRQDIKKISDYAESSWIDNDYEEVYTEYRTKQLLKGGASR